jgi:hypothetical protein
MAKAPTIKFPRIEAGFYSITKDGELVGYIMRELTDDKETNWYIFDNPTPDLDIAMLHPETAIDHPDDLFREAKENAKTYFLNRPVKAEVSTPVAPLEDAQWSEEDEDEEDELIEIEDHNLFVSDDGEIELFEDELMPLSDEIESDEIEYDTADEDEFALV